MSRYIHDSLCVISNSTIYFFTADLANWDEEDLIAQVMAQSQREYLDTLKKNVATATTSKMDCASSSSSTNNNRGPS